MEYWFSLFVERPDTYCIQKDSGAYERITTPVTDQDLQDHLVGKKTLGIYQLSKTNSVKWICFDFDGANIPEQFDLAKRLYSKLKNEDKIQTTLLEFSGKKGFHVWVFCQEIDAQSAQYWAKEVSDGFGVHEVFPKQTKIGEGYGNCVKLPLAFHRVAKRESQIMNDDFQPMPKEAAIAFLQEFEKLPRFQIPRIVYREIVRTVIEQKQEKKMPRNVTEQLAKGATEGDRHKQTFFIVKDLYNAGFGREEILEYALKFNAVCKPPKPDYLIVGHVNYLLSRPDKYLAKEVRNEDIDLKKVELESSVKYDIVMEAYRKWIYFKKPYAIDLALSVAISRKWSPVPIWIIMVAPSGSGKSELIRPLEDHKANPGTEIMSRITANTFLSGVNPKDQPHTDFGDELQGKPKLFLTYDFAQFVKLDPKEKGQVWAQLRDLYDGFLERKAFNVKKKIQNIKVNWLICSTPIVDSELLVHQELGTRELLYRHSAEEENENDLMDRVWSNTNSMNDMRLELNQIVRAFIDRREEEGERQVEILPAVKDEIKIMAKTISVLRAATETDNYTGELTNFVYPEKPTRLLIQLRALFVALKNLDPLYTDEQALECLRELTISSIHPIRLRIIMELMKTEELSTNEIQKKLSIGYKSVTGQLYTANQLGLVEYREEKDQTEEAAPKNWKKKVWRKTNHEVVEYLAKMNDLEARWISLFAKNYNSTPKTGERV